MNQWGLLVGALGLVAIITVYYLWLRKPAAKKEQPQQP
jgi:hypothetical protein